MRVGIGHDTHRLEPGRPLLLGGVRVEHPRGLAGHSDADVVLHAVTDALLGAAGLGDIGDAYPDDDPRWRGADSTLFLTETLARLNRAGWRVVNIDVIVFAQEPKLGPVKEASARTSPGCSAWPPTPSTSRPRPASASATSAAPRRWPARPWRLSTRIKKEEGGFRPFPCSVFFILFYSPSAN